LTDAQEFIMGGPLLPHSISTHSMDSGGIHQLGGLPSSQWLAPINANEIHNSAIICPWAMNFSGYSKRGIDVT